MPVEKCFNIKISTLVRYNVKRSIFFFICFTIGVTTTVIFNILNCLNLPTNGEFITDFGIFLDHEWLILQRGGCTLAQYCNAQIIK